MNDSKDRETLRELFADLLRWLGLKICKIGTFIEQRIGGSLIKAAVRIEDMHSCRSILVDKYRCEQPRNHGNDHMAHTDKGVEWWVDPI